MKPEIVETTALQAMQRAEIDSTIATAKRFPRDETLALKKVHDMVTGSPAIAEETHYSIPRKDKSGKRVNVQGPSVRFAEILAANWGNLHIASRVIDIGPKQVVSQGVCLDLESNVRHDVENRRAIVSRDGRRYSEDMITTTSNAAGAIAWRNAVLRAVPRPLWWPIYEAGLKAIGGSKTSLSERWHRAVAWFGSRGIDEARLQAAIGIRDARAVENEHLVTLTGWRNSIEQDANALEEIFGEAPEEEEAPPKKKRAARRAAPKEVKAKVYEAVDAKTGVPAADSKPEAAPSVRGEEPVKPWSRGESPDEESEEERERRKSKRWKEWTEQRTLLRSEDFATCREAAGVERIDLTIDVDAIEAVVKCASELLEGARE